MHDAFLLCRSITANINGAARWSMGCAFGRSLFYYLPPVEAENNERARLDTNLFGHLFRLHRRLRNELLQSFPCPFYYWGVAHDWQVKSCVCVFCVVSLMSTAFHAKHFTKLKLTTLLLLLDECMHRLFGEKKMRGECQSKPECEPTFVLSMHSTCCRFRTVWNLLRTHFSLFVFFLVCRWRKWAIILLPLG